MNRTSYRGTELTLAERLLGSWDSAATIPKHRQLYEQLRHIMLEGSLRPGARLPSTRFLADSLELGRNTVLSAYDQLLAEGYVESRQGAGTYVAHTLPDPTPRPAAPVEDPAGRRPTLSRRSAAILERIGRSRLPRTGPRQAFMPNVPDDRVLPWRIWQRLLVRHLRRSEPGWRGYTREGGHWPLRSVLADYLRLTRTVRCSPEQVIITGSTQHSLTLLAMSLADPGEPAWVENPGYQGASAAFEAAGLSVYPVPVDEQGLAWEDVNRPRPSVIYVTPSHQYPLGSVMSLSRRRALLELAHATDAWVIEDDYDGEFRHEGRPMASLQGLDGGERVIYLGTFSKALYPGIRVAYMVVPPALADPARVLNARLFREGQHVEQAALADFIHEGHFAAHIRRSRKLYRRRRDKLRAVFQRQLGERVPLLGGDAGMHLVASLGNDVDDVALSRAAARAGIVAPALSREHIGHAGRRGLILGYAGMDDAEIIRGAHKLAALLRTTVG